SCALSLVSLPEILRTISRQHCNRPHACSLVVPVFELIPFFSSRFSRPATSFSGQLWKRFPELPCLFLRLEKTYEEHRDLEPTLDDVPDVLRLCALDRSSPTAHGEAEHRKG